MYSNNFWNASGGLLSGFGLFTNMKNRIVPQTRQKMKQTGMNISFRSVNFAVFTEFSVINSEELLK